MRTTILSVLAVAATLTPQLSAQTVASIEPGDRVRISSDEISGEFTVAAVQGETLSFQVFDTDADIREVILTDGERINLNGVQYELDGDDLVLRGADLEGGETDNVIRNWTAIPIRVRHIPLGQIREIVKDDSALGFHPASHAVQIPMTDVRKLEVSSRSAAAGALRGATWGILGGGVLGCAIPITEIEWCPFIATGFGAIGGVLGLMVGSVTTRWEEVPLRDQLNIAPSRDGGVALRYQFNF